MRIPRLWLAISVAAALSASTVAAQCHQCQPHASANCGCASEGCGNGLYPCGTRGGSQGPYGRHFTLEDAVIDNCIWPRQYVMPSRRGICQAYDAMINNGWRRHNLLSKYHFDSQTGDLNEAGRLKTEWTLTQAPPQHRTLFVERNTDQQQTADRVAAVQTYAATMNPAAGAIDVQDTHIREHGHPAGNVDAVFTGFRTNQMTPTLPPAVDGGASSGQ
jgi:hypothetical protein